MWNTSKDRPVCVALQVLSVFFQTDSNHLICWASSKNEVQSSFQTRAESKSILAGGSTSLPPPAASQLLLPSFPVGFIHKLSTNPFVDSVGGCFVTNSALAALHQTLQTDTLIVCCRGDGMNTLAAVRRYIHKLRRRAVHHRFPS